MVGQIAKYAAIGTVSLVLGLKAISCTSNHDNNYVTTQNKRKEYQKEREIQKTIRDTTRNEKIVKYVNLVKSNIAHVFTAKPCKPKYHGGPANTTPNYNNKSVDTYNKSVADQQMASKLAAANKKIRDRDISDSINVLVENRANDLAQQQAQQQANDNYGGYVPTSIVTIGMSVGYRDRLPVHFDHAGHATTRPNRYDRASYIGGFR
jgi:hypothetical protein